MELNERLKQIPVRFLIIGGFVLLALLTITISLLTVPNKNADQADKNAFGTPQDNTNSPTSSSNLAKMNSEQKLKLIDTYRKDHSKLSFEDRSNITLAGINMPVLRPDFEIAYSFNLKEFFILRKSARAETAIKSYLEEAKIYTLYLEHPELFITASKPVLEAVQEREKPIIDIYESMPDTGSEVFEKKKQTKNIWGDIFGIAVHAQSAADSTNEGLRQGNDLIDIIKNTFRIDIGTESNPPSNSVLPPPPPPGGTPIGGGGKTREDFSGNCTNARGNEKIVCAALQFLDIRYANKDPRGTDWAALYGTTDNQLGLLGHPARQWLADREIGGYGDYLECSGYTDLAIYIAFGIDKYHCSAAYLSDTEYFQQVSTDELKPGDFLITSTACGNDGHIGIYVSTEANGRIRTLESAAYGNITNGNTASGYYLHNDGDFPYAVRYIGPGSTGTTPTNPNVF